MSDKMAIVMANMALVRGQAFKVMPIPVIEHNAEWFDAGPISFAVETRVLGEARDNLAVGGGSIHVFSADRSKEFVRFDCFDKEPHYHYLNHTDRVNTVWAYDSNMNGPMPQWTLSVLRDHLPSMLRAAGAGEVADRVEKEGFDKSVLKKLENAVETAHTRAVEDKEMVAEGKDWFGRWQEDNPGFATANL